MDTSTTPAAETKPALHQRHFKAFWPIVIIAVLSAIVGGFIVWAAFNQGLQDEINSLIPGANLHKTHNPASSSQADVLSQDTKDWQTYTNKEYGFEFKYPKSDYYPRIVELTEKTGTSTVSVTLEVQDAVKNKDYFDNIIWFSAGKPQTKAGEERIKKIQDNITANSNTKVDGILAEKTDGTNEIWVVKDQILYILNYKGFPHGEDSSEMSQAAIKASKLADAIFSTFKFTGTKN